MAKMHKMKFIFLSLLNNEKQKWHIFALVYRYVEEIANDCFITQLKMGQAVKFPNYTKKR